MRCSSVHGAMCMVRCSEVHYSSVHWAPVPGQAVDDSEAELMLVPGLAS